MLRSSYYVCDTKQALICRHTANLCCAEALDI